MVSLKGQLLASMVAAGPALTDCFFKMHLMDHCALLLWRCSKRRCLPTLHYLSSLSPLSCASRLSSPLSCPAGKIQMVFPIMLLCGLAVVITQMFVAVPLQLLSTKDQRFEIDNELFVCNSHYGLGVALPSCVTVFTARLLYSLVLIIF